MTIQVRCGCGKTSLYPDSYEGKPIACRACRAPLTVSGEKVRPVRPARWRLWLGIVLTLVIPATFATIFFRTRGPLFTSAAEEYREGSKASVDPKVDGPRIERLFAALAAATRDGNEHAFSSCFHERRMLAEIELRGGMDAVGVRRDEVELEGELGAVLRDWCDQLRNSLSSWQSVQRCTIKFIEGRGEAEAAVVMKATDHVSRYRFWLIKEQDQWLIFDCEALASGLRMSTHNARLLVRQVKGELSGHELDRAAALVDKAQNFLVRDKVDEAEECLKQAEALPHPGTWLPAVALLQAEVLLRRMRLEEALAKVDQALVHRRDYPKSIQLRGFILFGLKRFEEGIRSQEEFMKIVGDDSAAWMGIGMCQEALGDRARAKEAYRKGAACDDTDTEIRQRLKKLEESGN